MLLEEMKLRTAARIVADGGRVAQRQDSLSDQLADLHHLAVAFGLYDADDYVRTTNALLAAKCVELAALREAAQAVVARFDGWQFIYPHPIARLRVALNPAADEGEQ